MNIFISGGGGFIGSHLKQYLEKKYNYILLSPSSRELDLYDQNAVDTYMNTHKIDMILHCANRGGGRDSMNMSNVVEYNLRCFFNLEKYADRVDKFIYFGSGAEYSKHMPIIDVVEDDAKKMLPLDEYGLYKNILSKYAEKSKNILCMRLFGVYGEKENYRYKFISNAIVKNLLNLPITIGQNVDFDYLYIDDLCKMVDYFIHSDSRYKIYNASKGESISLMDIANIINQISESPSQIIVLKEGKNNPYTSNNARLLQEYNVVNGGETYFYFSSGCYKKYVSLLQDTHSSYKSRKNKTRQVYTKNRFHLENTLTNIFADRFVSYHRYIS